MLLFILDTSLNRLYWCEHFHTHELFTLRNSLTPAVRFITKHWQLRFLAVYKGQSIYRKYKELRDTSPGNPTPRPPWNQLCQQISDPWKGGSGAKEKALSSFKLTRAIWIVSSHNHGGNSGHEVHGHTQTPPQRTARCRGSADDSPPKQPTPSSTGRYQRPRSLMTIAMITIFD